MKIKLINPIAWLLITSAFFSMPSFASGVVGTGTPQSCTGAAFTTALTGGGLVTFNCGASPATIAINQVNLIKVATEIDGKNLITLDGQNKTGILETDGKFPLTLKGLTFQNGSAAKSGGAVKGGWRTDINIFGCTFKNNKANGGGEEGGGAVYLHESKAVIDNSTFTTNSANGQGGAINSILSDMKLSNSNLTGNKSPYGGALMVDGGKCRETAVPSDCPKDTTGNINITNTTFDNNSINPRGGSKGGAAYIFLYGKNSFAMTGGRIINNKSPEFGGGFAVAGEASTTFSFSSVEISGNSATAQGGGIWQSNDGTTVIRNCNIQNNNGASLGGGIGFISGNMRIEDSTIYKNTAGSGGGIFGGGNNLTLARTKVISNKATNTWGIQHNCSNSMKDGGGNTEYPVPDSKADPKNVWCTPGSTLAITINAPAPLPQSNPVTPPSNTVTTPPPVIATTPPKICACPAQVPINGCLQNYTLAAENYSYPCGATNLTCRKTVCKANSTSTPTINPPPLGATSPPPIKLATTNTVPVAKPAATPVPLNTQQFINNTTVTMTNAYKQFQDAMVKWYNSFFTRK